MNAPVDPRTLKEPAPPAWVLDLAREIGRQMAMADRKARQTPPVQRS